MWRKTRRKKTTDKKTLFKTGAGTSNEVPRWL